MTQVFTERCSTCIFRHSGRAAFGTELVREVIQANRAAGAALICHQSLSFGSHPEVGETICRGFWDAYRDDTRSILTMEDIFGSDVFTEVAPPTDHSPD